MQTLNQFIKLLQDYANSHYQINDFGFGDAWELVESFQNDDASINDAREYPVMWVEPTGSIISENELLDSYTVYFADRVLKGKKNEKDVLSDMKLLCLDLASYLQNAGINDDYNVVKQFSLDDFTEKFQDEVSGYSITIQVKQSFNYNECAIPYSGVTEQDNGGGGGEIAITINATAYGSFEGDVTIPVVTESLVAISNAIINPSTNVIIPNTELFINEVSVTEVSAGSDLAFEVVDSQNNYTGSFDVNVWRVGDSVAVIKNTAGTILLSENIPATTSEDIIIANDSVTNSDASVTVNTIVQGVSKVLSDVNHTQPNGDIVAYPSMKPFVSTQINALATQDLNDQLTPTQINQIQRQQPTRTGQTTSYRTGDDGDLEMGIGASFSTLSDNNIWGNTNRFTDDTGEQTYANNFVLDHLTGLMWHKIPNAVDTWNNAIDGCLAYAGGTFTDWFLANVSQHNTIMSWEVGAIGLNYAPFSISSAEFYWTSTTLPSSTTNAIRLNNTSSLPVAQAKTNTSKYLYCRQWIPADFGL